MEIFKLNASLFEKYLKRLRGTLVPGRLATNEIKENTMLRKINAVLTLSLVANPSLANFYLGGAIGPEGALFTQKAHIVGQNFNAFDTNHFAGAGAFGSIFAGYACPFHRLYLAGEINANLSSVTYELTNIEIIHANHQKTTFTVNTSGGIGVLPGVLLTETTLFYARLGIANGHININESDPTIDSSISNRFGFRYGLGLRFAVSPCWAGLMEYSQIHYQGIASTVFEPFGGVLKETKINPNTAQVAFGLMYSFDGTNS